MPTLTILARRRARRARRTRIGSRGFTLLEMLVVLIIVGLVTSILFQALSQIYKLQSRFGVQLAESQQGAMYNDWFRQIVQGLQNDYVNGKDQFQGTDHDFIGVTTSPLSADYGSPTKVTLSLEYNDDDEVTELFYSANDRKTMLSSWAGRKAIRFVYVDANGDQHDTWPPPFGLWPQLPNMVFLQYQKDGEPQYLAAGPRGSLEPKEPPHAMLGAAP